MEHKEKEFLESRMRMALEELVIKQSSEINNILGHESRMRMGLEELVDKQIFEINNLRNEIIKLNRQISEKSLSPKKKKFSFCCS